MGLFDFVEDALTTVVETPRKIVDMSGNAVAKVAKEAVQTPDVIADNVDKVLSSLLDSD